MHNNLKEQLFADEAKSGTNVCRNLNMHIQKSIKNYFE